MSDEYGWVIERYINGVLHYWAGHAADDFNSDHLRAIRFSRREDAAIVLAWLCSGLGNPAEHKWVNLPPLGPNGHLIKTAEGA